jgi:hypothetical protein
MIYIMADSRYDARKLADRNGLTPCEYTIVRDKFDIEDDLLETSSIWIAGNYLNNPLYKMLRDIISNLKIDYTLK